MYHDKDIPLQILDNYPVAQVLSVIYTSLRAAQTNCSIQISLPKHQISQTNISKNISNKYFIKYLPEKYQFSFSDDTRVHSKFQEGNQLASVNSLNSILNSNFVVCTCVQIFSEGKSDFPPEKFAFWKM